MSEKSGASVGNDEVDAVSEPGGSSHGEPLAASRVPVQTRARQAASDDDGDGFDDEAAVARPTGKRGRRRASADDAAHVDGRRRAKEAKEGKKPKRSQAGASRNPFAAIVQFLREVVNELSKVIWPQRRQMVSYTLIVIVFVAVVVSFVAFLDIGFAKLALWLLG